MKHLFFFFIAIFLAGCQAETPVPNLESAHVVQAKVRQSSQVDFVGGIFRIDANGTPTLLNSSNHKSRNISHVENHNGALRVHFTQSIETITFASDEDESLPHYRVKWKVETNYADGRFFEIIPRFVSGNFTFDGQLWNFQGDQGSESISPISNGPNMLIFGHEKGTSEYNINKTTHRLGIEYVSHKSIQDMNTRIDILGNPQVGDSFRVFRALHDHKGRPVHLQNVKGCYMCNVELFVLFE